jgi:acid phosphatase family membrane protein YuiD
VVNVAVPPVTLTLTPHWSGGMPGRHGMTIISTTAAIDVADGSDSKTAKINILIQLCLCITRSTLYFTTSRTHPTKANA